jgi:hypothetical protein
MVVPEAGDAAQDRQPQQPAQPDIARNAPPDFDRAIGADIEPTVPIDTMEAPPHVLDPRAETRQCVRFEIDVAKSTS